MAALTHHSYHWCHQGLCGASRVPLVPFQNFVSSFGFFCPLLIPSSWSPPSPPAPHCLLLIFVIPSRFPLSPLVPAVTSWSPPSSPMLHHHLLVTIKSSRSPLSPSDPLIPSQSQSGLSGHHHLSPDPCCLLLGSVITSWSPPSPSGPLCPQLCSTISLRSRSGPSGHHHPCLSLVVPSWSLPPAPRLHHPLLVPSPPPGPCHLLLVPVTPLQSS